MGVQPPVEILSVAGVEGPVGAADDVDEGHELYSTRMLTRRHLLLTPLAVAAAQSLTSSPAEAQGKPGNMTGNKAGKMSLAFHQNTSTGAGYQKSLEGWGKAGIKYVELTSNLLDDFLKTETLATAIRIGTSLSRCKAARASSSSITNTIRAA